MSVQVLCGLVALFGQYQVATSECGWNVEFTNFPNAFKYYSTCNKEQYLNVTLESLVEMDKIIGRVNPIAFGLPPAAEWSWADTAGSSSSYEGYGVAANTYSANLSSFLRPLGRNAALNLNTYLFEENATFTVYNSTQLQVSMQKYWLKWEISIQDWPWLEAADTLVLCLNFETPNATHETEGSYDWTNISYADGFHFAFPNWFTCDDDMQTLDVDGPNQVPNSTTLQVCITIPHCAGEIFYDPFISSSYQGVEKKTESKAMLKVVLIGGIVLGAGAGLTIICCLVMCIKRRACAGGGAGFSEGLVGNDNSINYGSK